MQISAFVDGELPQNEAELLLRRLCQDVELRQQAAEYLAMGRVMRGERVVAGLGMLRERVAASLDDKELEREFDTRRGSSPRFVRPLAGVAIAASVALAALLGLQQLNTVPPETEVQADLITEPVAVEDPMLRYYLSHSEARPSSIFPRMIYESRDAADFERLVNEAEAESADVDDEKDDALPGEPAGTQTP